MMMACMRCVVRAQRDDRPRRWRAAEGGGLGWTVHAIVDGCLLELIVNGQTALVASQSRPQPLDDVKTGTPASVLRCASCIGAERKSSMPCCCEPPPLLGLQFCWRGARMAHRVAYAHDDAVRDSLT